MFEPLTRREEIESRCQVLPNNVAVFGEQEAIAHADAWAKIEMAIDNAT